MLIMIITVNFTEQEAFYIQNLIKTQRAQYEQLLNLSIRSLDKLEGSIKANKEFQDAIGAPIKNYDGMEGTSITNQGVLNGHEKTDNESSAATQNS